MRSCTPAKTVTTYTMYTAVLFFYFVAHSKGHGRGSYYSSNWDTLGVVDTMTCAQHCGSSTDAAPRSHLREVKNSPTCSHRYVMVDKSSKLGNQYWSRLVPGRVNL